MAGTKKATGTAAAPKKAASTAAHPSYQDMIKEAILQLKDRGGSSRQAIKKHVLANHPSVTNVSENAFVTQLNKALQRGTESGVFLRPKGPSGPVKLAVSKPAAKTEAKPKAAKAAAPKKTGTAAPKKATKAAATKKTDAKPKAAATKKAAAPKKAAATKTKANTSKAAPAVEDKAPVVLGKTKSGRVTKTKAPGATKAAPKKKAAATKKATPKKAAAATTA